MNVARKIGSATKSGQYRPKITHAHTQLSLGWQRPELSLSLIELKSIYYHWTYLKWICDQNELLKRFSALTYTHALNPIPYRLRSISFAFCPFFPSSSSSFSASISLQFYFVHRPKVNNLL